MFGVAWFLSARRERVGEPAERLAADAARPAGDVVPLGGYPPRDLALERMLTSQAGELAGVRWAVLTHFAEHRAKSGPVLEPDGRDLAMEVLEELADARNYLVWRAVSETRRRPPDDDVLAHASRALIHVVRAFDAAMEMVETETAVTSVATGSAAEPPPVTKSQAEKQRRKRQRERLKGDIQQLRGILGKQGKLLRHARLDLEMLLDATAAYVVDDPERASGNWVACNERLVAARAQVQETLRVLAEKRGETT